MSRTHHNRIRNKWWWGFLDESKDLGFFVSDSDLVVIKADGAWIMKSL